MTPHRALARLRDALHTLRHSMRDVLGDSDLVRLVGDRVMLRPGAVRVDVLQSRRHAERGRHRRRSGRARPGARRMAGHGQVAVPRLRGARPADQRREPRGETRAGAEARLGHRRLPAERDRHAVGRLSADRAGRRDRRRARPDPRADRDLERVGRQRGCGQARPAAGAGAGFSARWLAAAGRRAVAGHGEAASTRRTAWCSGRRISITNTTTCSQSSRTSPAWSRPGWSRRFPAIAAERMKRGGEAGDGAYGLILRAIATDPPAGAAFVHRGGRVADAGRSISSPSIARPIAGWRCGTCFWSARAGRATRRRASRGPGRPPSMP